ncbi:T9SS type A sorting domain-containing protein [Paracrocinitomix mangrovi]|uniref:T9SS type A sorting domain-containing protein n=1 Tax=Paracrocinitomix mangrovi TaxID=2862509 RepID=UPI001C8EEE0B|nr:T9SS type A sorting domain-containing protein [Paracrocinitomix mangrovi]UKN02416.1 T9SS type A sorting domain-containing protein [Paracrocinitomix mangrovi]
MKSFGNSGYDFGRDILQTPDTGYIATGSSSSFVSQNADAFLLKLDSLGNFEWSRNYGGSATEWGESIVLTSENGFAIGGYTNSYGSGGFDFYLVKTDSMGTPVWEQYYGGNDWDKCFGLAQLPDSGFVMVGETFSFGAGMNDGFILRTDKNGDTLWTKAFGGVMEDWFNGVYVDGDSIVAVGQTNSSGNGDFDGWIVKCDLNGNAGWEVVTGHPELDYFNSVTKNNSTYTMGGARTINTIHYYDFWIYQISEDGLTEIADTSWAGDQEGYDIVYDIVVEPSTNNIYYGGSTTSWGSGDVSTGVPEFFISRVDAGYGWTPYLQNFGLDGFDEIRGMDYCHDNGIIAIGTTELVSTGGKNVYIIKIDESNSWNQSPGVFINSVLDQITTSTEEILPQDFSIYPVPVIDHLKFSQFVEDVRIYDTSGKLMLSNMSKTQEVTLSDLSSGMYIVQFNLDGQVYRKKIIKD